MGLASVTGVCSADPSPTKMSPCPGTFDENYTDDEYDIDENINNTYDDLLNKIRGGYSKNAPVCFAKQEQFDCINQA